MSRAARTERTPVHEQPIIGGTNLGDPLRATDKCWFYVLGTIVPFVAGPGSQCNMLSTSTSARLGHHTVVSAPDGVLWLAPIGDSLDDPAHRIAAVQVGKPWALPDGLRTTPIAPAARTALASPTRPVAARARDSSDRTVRFAPEDDSKEEEQDSQDGDNQRESAPRANRPSKRVDPMWFRGMLGNPSTRSIKAAANKVKAEVCVPTDGAVSHHCDRANRIANGKALGMQHVAKTKEQQRHMQVVSDTCGTKQPRAKSGARHFRSWVLLARDSEGNVHVDDTCVTFSEGNDAQGSLEGFTAMCQEAGLTVCRDAMSQSIEIVTDNGKECLGQFMAGMKKAGIKVSTSTANSDQKGLVGHAESANATLQQTGRSIMALAKPNFAHYGLDVVDYWDRAVRHGALQRRWLRRMLRSGASYKQAARATCAPFGARGEVGLMLTGAERKTDDRGKQFADRMASALFLGITTDGKAIMTEPDGTVHTSVHVRFGGDAMPAVPPPITGTTHTASEDSTDEQANTDNNADDTAEATATTTGNNGDSTTAKVTAKTKRRGQRRKRRIDNGAPTTAAAGDADSNDNNDSANAPVGATAVNSGGTATTKTTRRRQRRAGQAGHAQAAHRGTGTPNNTKSQQTTPAQRSKGRQKRGSTPDNPSVVKSKGRAAVPAPTSQMHAAPRMANTRTNAARRSRTPHVMPATRPSVRRAQPKEQEKRHQKKKGYMPQHQRRTHRGSTTATGNAEIEAPGAATARDGASTGRGGGAGQQTSASASKHKDTAGPRQSARQQGQRERQAIGDEPATHADTGCDGTTHGPDGAATTGARSTDQALGNDSKRSFVDSSGHRVTIGDHVSMRWPGQGTYDGIVIAVQPDSPGTPGGAYRVAYADDTDEWHAIRGGHRLTAKRRAHFTTNHKTDERERVQRDLDEAHRQAQDASDPHDGPRVYRTMRSTATRPARATSSDHSSRVPRICLQHPNYPTYPRAQSLLRRPPSTRH